MVLFAPSSFAELGYLPLQQNVLHLRPAGSRKVMPKEGEKSDAPPATKTEPLDPDPKKLAPSAPVRSSQGLREWGRVRNQGVGPEPGTGSGTSLWPRNQGVGPGPRPRAANLGYPADLGYEAKESWFLCFWAPGSWRRSWKTLAAFGPGQGPGPSAQSPSETAFFCSGARDGGPGLFPPGTGPGSVDLEAGAKKTGSSGPGRKQARLPGPGP